MSCVIVCHNNNKQRRSQTRTNRAATLPRLGIPRARNPTSLDLPAETVFSPRLAPYLRWSNALRVVWTIGYKSLGCETGSPRKKAASKIGRFAPRAPFSASSPSRHPSTGFTEIAFALEKLREALNQG